MTLQDSVTISSQCVLFCVYAVLQRHRILGTYISVFAGYWSDLRESYIFRTSYAFGRCVITIAHLYCFVSTQQLLAVVMLINCFIGIWFNVLFNLYFLVQVMWTRLPCQNFHLLVCCAILDSEKQKIMDRKYGFNEILKVSVNCILYTTIQS